MKRVLCIVLMLGTVAVDVATRGGNRLDAPDQSDEVSQNLVQWELEERAAALRGDVSVLAKILAENYAETYPDGGVVPDRTRAITLYAGCYQERCIESNVITDVQVRRFGDAAIVSYVSTLKYKTKAYEDKLQVTNFWARYGGKWQRVAKQATSIVYE